MERILKFLLLALINLNGVLSEDSPRLEIQPSFNTIWKSLGGKVYISCQAIVPNQESVNGMKWFGPDGVQIPNPERPSVQLLTGKRLNQLNLYITNLKEEDTGIYNCSATYTGNQNLNAHLTVASYKKITFQDVKPKQTFAIGTDAKIKCLVTGDPAPKVDFLKGGNKIRENDPKIIIMADGILIKKIQVEDEGVYVCRARVPSLGEMKLEDIQVEVHIPPEITGAPQDIAGVEKESVAFQCVAKGKPAPNYSWVNKYNEVLNNKEGYYVDEIKGELRIMDLKPEHTGTYRCTAKNAADEVTTEAYLTVLKKPKIEEYKNITVGVDDSAIMKCIVTGDPLPEVIFTKEGSTPFETGVNQDDRIFIKQEEDDQRRRVGIMEISGIRRKDDGLYTCTGNSSGGVTVAWGHITVEFAPLFEDFWIWEQKPVNISFLATSIPNATGGSTSEEKESKDKENCCNEQFINSILTKFEERIMAAVNLSLSKIELKNLALNKESRSSSSYDQQHSSDKGNDGTYTGLYHSAIGDQKPWWSVDLGAIYTVSYIQVYIRIGQIHRFSNIKVYIANETVWTASDFSKSYLFEEFAGPAISTTVRIYPNKYEPKGRFVYITKDKPADVYLEFFELEVMGYGNNLR